MPVRLPSNALEGKPERAKRQAEASVDAVCCDWLRLMGWRVTRHRNNAVAGKPGEMHMVRGDPQDKGFPDRLVFGFPWFFMVETKRPKGGTFKPEQLALQQDPRVAPYIIPARSLEQLRAGMAERGVPERAPRGKS